MRRAYEWGGVWLRYLYPRGNVLTETIASAGK